MARGLTVMVKRKNIEAREVVVVEVMLALVSVEMQKNLDTGKLKIFQENMVLQIRRVKNHQRYLFHN